MHRLWRVRPRMSGGGHLCARRDAREMEELHSRERAVLPEVEFASRRQSSPGNRGADVRRFLQFAVTLAALGAAPLSLRAVGPISAGDAELQIQLANLLIEENRYSEALQAFERAIGTDDPALAVRARKGKVRMS